MAHLTTLDAGFLGAEDSGAPAWVDDPHFDIARHVRRRGLPHPGDDRELFRLGADAMSWRLNRGRPLWEIWVIEGLSDNRWAMLMKVHHCIADGIATAHMLAGLSDGGIGDSFANRIDPLFTNLQTVAARAGWWPM